MKKLFLFLACSALLITGCSDDDNAGTTNDLTGIWKETDPTPNGRTFKFDTTTALLTRRDGSSDTYTYAIQNNKLLLTLPGTDNGTTEHDIKWINKTTMTLGNIYIQEDIANSTPIITTFKKQ